MDFLWAPPPKTHVAYINKNRPTTRYAFGIYMCVYVYIFLYMMYGS